VGGLMATIELTDEELNSLPDNNNQTGTISLSDDEIMNLPDINPTDTAISSAQQDADQFLKTGDIKNWNRLKERPEENQPSLINNLAEEFPKTSGFIEGAVGSLPVQAAIKTGEAAEKYIINPISTKVADVQNSARRSIVNPLLENITGKKLSEETNKQLDVITDVGTNAAANMVLPEIGAVGAGKIISKAPTIIKNIITPSAENALTKAISPGKWNLKFKKDAPIALQEIKKVIPNIDDIPEGEALQTFIAGVKQAKQNVWNEIETAINKSQSELKYGAKTVTEEMPITKGLLLDARGNKMPIQTKQVSRQVKILENGINGNEVANNMKGAIDSATEELTPAIGNAIRRETKKYIDKNITIKGAEDRLQQLNSELTSFFQSKPRSQWVKSNTSNLTAMLTERKMLKDALYNKIESLSGKDITPLKRKYGALMNVMDEALGRLNVAERQKPVSLQEAINMAFGGAKILHGDLSGIFQIASSKTIKSLNSSDSLIRTALRKTKLLSEKQSNKLISE
jgi:hypothetical protein